MSEVRFGIAGCALDTRDGAQPSSIEEELSALDKVIDEQTERKRGMMDTPYGILTAMSEADWLISLHRRRECIVMEMRRRRSIGD